MHATKRNTTTQNTLRSLSPVTLNALFLVSSLIRFRGLSADMNACSCLALTWRMTQACCASAASRACPTCRPPAWVTRFVSPSHIPCENLQCQLSRDAWYPFAKPSSMSLPCHLCCFSTVVSSQVVSGPHLYRAKSLTSSCPLCLLLMSVGSSSNAHPVSTGCHHGCVLWSRGHSRRYLPVAGPPQRFPRALLLVSRADACVSRFLRRCTPRSLAA